MTTIVTRAGKGDTLSWVEVDTNFTNLNTDKLENIVADTTPQLGGNLDVNGNSIVSTSNANIAISPNGTGKVVLDGVSWPASDGSANQVLTTNGSGTLSWATPSGGGSNIILIGSTQSGDPKSSIGFPDTLNIVHNETLVVMSSGGVSGVSITSNKTIVLPAGTYIFRNIICSTNLANVAIGLRNITGSKWIGGNLFFRSLTYNGSTRYVMEAHQLRFVLSVSSELQFWTRYFDSTANSFTVVTGYNDSSANGGESNPGISQFNFEFIKIA